MFLLFFIPNGIHFYNLFCIRESESVQKSSEFGSLCFFSTVNLESVHLVFVLLRCPKCLVWWNIMEPVRVVRGRLQQTLHHQLKEEVENLQQNTLQVSLRLSY
jgi:hypothetical protein